MEGGRIVQCGTPQDIFSRPVNEYVADFVAHMNPLGVLRAQDVMEPATGEAGETVPARMHVEEVMRQLIDDDRPIAVEDAGQVVGQVTRRGVLAGILDPRETGAAGDKPQS